MKTFTQNNKSFIAIYVPEGAHDFSIEWGDSNVIDAEKMELWYADKDGLSCYEYLYENNYEIISLLSSLPESKAAEMVDCKKVNWGYTYPNYLTTGGWFEWSDSKNKSMSILSLTSRLMSLGLDVSKPILIIEILK